MAIANEALSSLKEVLTDPAVSFRLACTEDLARYHAEYAEKWLLR
jgi:hypothetical protein